MKAYTPDSPEAISRLLAMFMITDGSMDPREMESLENLHVYEILGLSRKQFIQILVDYCNDLTDEAEQDGTIHLIDRNRIDALLEDITDRKSRILSCALALDMCKAHDSISESEMTLLRYMMDHWEITLEDIELEFVKP